MIFNLYKTIMLDLEFLHGGRFPRCQARIDRRFAGYHTLQCMAAGAVVHACDNRERRLEGAWCWGTPHGPRLRYGPAGSDGWWDHRYVAFRGPLADRWAADGLIPGEPQPTPDPPGFARGADRMLALIERGGTWDRHLAANQLERLLLELRAARTGAGGDAGLAAAIAAAGDPERRCSLAELARLARCSIVHLRRRFVAATGAPPARYARAARIRRARALLAEGDQPVKRIAELLGFSDVQHFTRCFTVATGQPPAAYRRLAGRD